MTALYGVYCFLILAVIHNLDGDCLTTTECRAEGTDNAPIAYLSQFFVGGIICLLGIHIMISLKNGPRCKGSIAFFVWAAAHALWGLIGWKYGNDGTEDGKGLRIYFFLNLLAYGLHTEALMEIASLASRLWFTLFEEYKPRLCSNLMVRCLQFTLGLVTATIVGGSLWCGFTPEVWVKESLDRYPNDINLPVHQCIQIVDIAQLVYTVSSALVWIAISFLFEASANQQISEWNQWYYVWGMPTSLSAAAVVGCQASLVLFHLLAYLVVENHAQDEPDNEVLMAGSIAYNYANLMTGYFVHSLVCSMSMRHEPHIERDVDNPEEDEERASYISHDICSNDLYNSIEVKPSNVSQASRKDEEEDTDRTDDGTSSSSSMDGDVEQGRDVDVEAIQNELTKPIQDIIPLHEPEPQIMSTIADGETHSATEPLDNGTIHQQEQHLLSSSIPLTRTTTVDVGKSTVCGFSMPWISQCLDVPPNSATLEAKESSLMMDFVQSMFSNTDQSFERGVIVSDGDQLDERGPTYPVALDPPSNQTPSINCTTIGKVAPPDDNFLIQHIREHSTMDSMGTMFLPLQESIDRLEEEITNEPQNEVSQTIPSLLSGSMHVAPPNVVDSDSSTCSVASKENVVDSDSSTCSVASMASKNTSNCPMLSSGHDGSNCDDERTPW